MKWPSLVSDLDLTVSLASDNTNDQQDLKAYWAQVRNKHASICFDGKDTFNLDTLPLDWVVISINVTEDRNTMFISRHQKSHEPLVFCIPLDRQGRREGDDESDIFTFDVGSKELKDIISASDHLSHTTSEYTTREQKIDWWAQRTALDQRMSELLTNMEFCWLGAFKVSRDVVRMTDIIDHTQSEGCSER